MKKLFFATFLSVLFILPACSSAESKPTTTKSTSEVVIENIMSRRSIRAYKAAPIAQDTIDLILKTAINAPSANNKQPWEVRVVQNPEVLSQIKALNERGFYDAPVVIVIACDTNNPFGAFDSGLLTQNILLTAESLGLGTCALGGLARTLVTPEAKPVRDLFNLSDGYEIIVCVALGHKDQFPEAKPREMEKVQVL